VSDEPNLRRQLALDRFWDEVVEGGRARATDPDLDPTLAEAIRRLQSLDTAPEEDPAFGPRLWEDLMQGHAFGGTIPLRPIVPGANGRSNGHTPSRPRSTVAPRRSPGRLTTALSYAATAALIAAVLAMIFFVYHNQQNAAIPPAQETPTAVATPPTTPAAHTWPMYGGGGARTRNVPGPGPKDQPVVRWTFPADGAANPHANVDRGALADGVLYLPTAAGLIALDAASGKELWHVDGYGDGVAVDGDGLIVYGFDGSLARLRRTDGSVAWTAEQGNMQTPWNPVVADGVGYTPSGSDFVAFDPATGKILWRVALNTPASRGGSAAGGIAVVGDVKGTVYGITANGDIAWTYETSATTIGHPALANGAVYVFASGGAQNAFLALDAATGALKWRFVAPDGAEFRGPAVDATTVYVGSLTQTLYALDAQTGTVKWSSNMGGYWIQGPVLADGVLYTSEGSAPGAVYAVDAATGATQWTLPVDGSTSGGAIVVDGVLYVSTDAGKVYAIGGAEGATPEASPDTSATSASASGSSPQVQFLWAATGSVTDALDHPLGLSLSPDGKLWVADYTSRFFIFDLDGNLLEVWGTPGTGPGQFSFYDAHYEIGGAVFLPDGSFYVVDSLNHRIQRFDKDRALLGSFGTRGSGDGQFLLPLALVVAPDGDLLVSDYLRGDVQRFDPSGKFLGRFDGAGTPGGPLRAPSGMAFDDAGHLLVVEADANRVRLFAPNGQELGTLGANGPDVGGLNYPISVSVDEHGYIYVADESNNRIVIFDPEGRFVGRFGEEGTGEGQFSRMSGFALNKGGTIYVGDTGGNRVEKFKLTGPFPAP
jgi:outer membrane protein assembly factor BamB